jgi:hypothetical protein
LAPAAALPTALIATLLASGCGTPGAPLPPSLKLPDPVTDLAAARTGNQVSLSWTMPKKNTDKMLLKGSIPVRICRRESTEACAAVPEKLALAPAAEGKFTETLPPTLATGPARPLTYFVELTNARGRSAGLSNSAQVLAGEAPSAVVGLTAQVRKQGVVLEWKPDAESEPATDIVIRLQRTLLTPKPPAKAEPGTLPPPVEPLEQNLLVDSGGKSTKSGGATERTLDQSIRVGEAYEYRAQRVARVTVSGESQDGKTTLELAGPLSDPVRVEAIDIFPPAVPTGLAAVATAADATTTPSTGPSIDLSWQPVTDADLAGYVVYRREAGSGWERISAAQPVVGPGFHDPNVQPGITYHYTVSAIDQSGHESARSGEAEETVPSQ